MNIDYDPELIVKEPLFDRSASQTKEHHTKLRLYDLSDPFTAPLVGALNSFSSFFTTTGSDHFSALVQRLCRFPGGKYTEIVNELQTMLLLNASNEDIFGVLFDKILKNSEFDTYSKIMVVRAVTVFSVNNGNICRMTFQKINDFFDFLDDKEFIVDILELFHTTVSYASKLDAVKIVENFYMKRNLLHYKSDEKLKIFVRSKVLYIFSILSKYGSIFPVSLVRDILDRCNYPSPNNSYKIEFKIAYPSLMFIESMLKQVHTEGFAFLETNPKLLYKISLSVISSVHCDNIKIKILSLQVLYSITIRFYANENIKKIPEIYYNLLAALTALNSFDDLRIKKITSMLIPKYINRT